MTPKNILSVCQNEASFEEIVDALFDLRQEGIIDVTSDKKFYRSEDGE